ncbi:hypothetical protein C6361_09775 [Plantactinospora sp. BC1]|nr:hypothetical protein C6361_09775 [Plantactinospora sp. BC1]
MSARSELASPAVASRGQAPVSARSELASPAVASRGQAPVSARSELAPMRTLTQRVSTAAANGWWAR